MRDYDGANSQVQRCGLISVTQRAFLFSYHMLSSYITEGQNYISEPH